MGYDRWDTNAYASNTATRASLKGKTDFTKTSVHEAFENRSMPQALDPRKITVRESCDSEKNPNSTPIIIGLDVTGSMGRYAHKIATTQLPNVMEGIYEQSPVSDPHIMFVGIGDVTCDSAPLQVSQFEAGADAIVDQLTSLYIEGHGGGNSYESYDLPWYFAAEKTKIDSFDKRGVKGFIFTLGDELPPQQDLRRHDLERVVSGDNFVVYENTKALLEAVQKRYRVFHLVIEEGSYASSHLRSVREQWTNLLGPNAIFVRNYEYLPQIIIATLQIADGADINAVLDHTESSIREELVYAFHNAINPQN
jgi:hypothetical protein